MINIYTIIPLIAWLVAGTIKFVINYIMHKKDAFRLIGNGGFPSTHTTIASSITMLIGFTEGFDQPLFGLGISFLFIVMIDATGIRRTLGKHAQFINKYVKPQEGVLRERQGHTKFEVLGGLFVGSIVAYLASLLL